MLHGPLFSKIVLFVIPLALSSVLQQLFNSADIAVVGHFAGSQALAAVGSNGSVINIIVNMFVGLSTGANAVLARYIGEGRNDKISDAVHTIISIALISGVVLIFLGISLSRYILELINSPDDVIDLATLYLRIYFLGMPFMMIYNFGSAVLRSQGDTKRPLFILSIAGVVNLILNLVLVIVFDLGVAGVAIATVVSNGVSSIMILYLIIKYPAPFHLDLRKLRINNDPLIAILKIGVPSGLQSIVFSISNLCIMSGINSFGAACIAGNTTATNLDQYVYFFISAFAQATVTFTSQNYGACNKERCNKIFLYNAIASTVLVAVMSIFYFVFAGTIVYIFTSDPEVIEYAVQRLRIVTPFSCLMCFYEISGAAMRGLGLPMLPTVVSIIGTCVIRLFWVFWIFPFYPTYIFLTIIYPISWAITGMAMLLFYFKSRNRCYKIMYMMRQG